MSITKIIFDAMETQNTLKTKKDYNHALTVNASPKQAADLIGKVDKWWAKKVKGKSGKLDNEFSVHFGTTFVNFRITEFEAGKKIIWLVTDCYLDWINDKTEWNGTRVIWRLAE